MRIHALTTDRGGCFHYRVRQPLTALRDLGHWTSWGSGIDLETFERADVLVNQLLHYPETTDSWVRWCESGEKLCVWEADDDIFTVHTSPHHGSAYDRPDTIPRMKRMIAASHLVTVTTPELAEVYRPFNPHVVVIPNAVPDWLTKLPVARTNDTRRGRLVLGYTGSPSHASDYEEWSADVLVRHMRRHLDRTLLRYYGLSGRPLGLPAVWPADVRPWERQTSAYLRALSMDVGIAPLADTAFNRGKSGVKALEYGALGIPAVVQDVPQYRATVLDGQTGFLASTPAQWLAAMDELWRDPARRIEVGSAAREYVRENHTMSVIAPMYESAFRSAAERIGIRG
jgi:glycosyltransferase involved in cell wall biosynthesis